MMLDQGKSQSILLVAISSVLCQLGILIEPSFAQSVTLAQKGPINNSNKSFNFPTNIALAAYPRRSFPKFRDQVIPGSSFYQFRENLKQAIKERNAKFIQAIADPQIKITFGPALKFSTLGFDNPNSLAWQRLERIISIGCTPYEAPAGVEIEAYQCPHISQSALGDPFSDIYIIGENVNVRSQPKLDSEVIGVLSNEIVKSDPQGFEPLTQQQRELTQTFVGWLPIITPEGKQGYVSSRYAYFAAGYRARFENKNGQWKMTIFITGD